MQNASRDRVIDELYQAHRGAVSRVCSSILRNADDAADATQEVFLIALESLDLEAKSGAARAWLMTVARNHCLDLLRRRKRLGKALVMLGPDDDRRGTDMENAVADRDFVDNVFKQLSGRERQALWQSAVESRPLADIASGLRLSYMAAAQVLHRARRHAVQVAARVAVVLGIVQLGRPRPGSVSLATVQRLAAVAAVPLIVVSMSTSSPATQTASAASPPPRSHVSSSSPARVSDLPRGAPDSLPSAVRSGVGGVIPGSVATLNAATDTIDRLLIGPLPAVPSVVGKPPTPPSVPAVPPLPLH